MDCNRTQKESKLNWNDIEKNYIQTIIKKNMNTRRNKNLSDWSQPYAKIITNAGTSLGLTEGMVELSSEMTAGRTIEHVFTRRLVSLTQSSGRRRDHERVSVHLLDVRVIQDFVQVVEQFIHAGVVEWRHRRRRKCLLVARQRQVGVQTVVATGTGRCDVISQTGHSTASLRTCRNVTDLRDVTYVLR